MSKITSNHGKNKWSVSLGTTRNTKASSNRIYSFHGRTTNTPLYSMFQFSPPVSSTIPPTIQVKDYLEGFVSYLIE